MELPRCEQFDMGRCPNCPLKSAVARLIVRNQVAEQNGTSQLNPRTEIFQPAHNAEKGLTAGDNEKFNIIITGEESFYTIDDRECAGPIEVTDMGFGVTYEKLQCGAAIVSKT